MAAPASSRSSSGSVFRRLSTAADGQFNPIGPRTGPALERGSSCRVWQSLAATYRGAKAMIRKLKSGEYRLYSRKVDPKTGKRRNLGTFETREAAEKHEREVQFFKRH